MYAAIGRVLGLITTDKFSTNSQLSEPFAVRVQKLHTRDTPAQGEPHCPRYIPTGYYSPAMHALGTTPRAAAGAPRPPRAARRAAVSRRAAVAVAARRGGGMGRGGMPPMGPPGGGGGGGTSWDPENLLGAPREGLIQRRMMAKQMEKDREFAAAVTATKDDIRKQVLLRRSQRAPPDDPSELVEYFLNTDAEDMEFEVARCRWGVFLTAGRPRAASARCVHVGAGTVRRAGAGCMQAGGRGRRAGGARAAAGARNPNLETLNPPTPQPLNPSTPQPSLPIDPSNPQ